METERENKLHVGIQCDGIKQLIAVLPAYVRRIEDLEAGQKLHTKSITDIEKMQGETNVYIKIILEKIDKLDGNMFGYVKEAMRDATKERREDRNLDFRERQENLKFKQIDVNTQSIERVKITIKWQSLIKYVVGATIGALIAGIVTIAMNGGF